MLLFWFFFYILRFFKQRGHLKYIDENVCLLVTQRHKIVAKIIKNKTFIFLWDENSKDTTIE